MDSIKAEPPEDPTEPSFYAAIRPEFVDPSGPVVITLRGATAFASQDVQILVNFADHIEVGWIATLPGSIDEDGNADIAFAGFDVVRETAVWIDRIIGPVDTYQFELIEPAIVSISDADSSLRSSDVLKQILAEQHAKFNVPLGAPTSPGATEHRLVYAIENVLLTNHLKLPGVEIRPLERRPTGSEERELLELAVKASGWQTTVPEVNWGGQYASNNPWIMMTFRSVWARDYAEAERVAREARDRVLALLALSRRAVGRPVGVVIESRQPDDSVVSKIRLERPVYAGNLAGGQLAGESQSALLASSESIERDPLLRLCVDLYAEATSNQTDDARYFRLWTILETLARARVPSGLPVQLLNGATWPNGSTTNQAAPAVYQYLRSALPSIEVQHVLTPAPDLYTAVRAWYGRRNATAHQGRFARNERGTATHDAFRFTCLTPDSVYGQRDPWLGALNEVTNLLLASELR